MVTIFRQEIIPGILIVLAVCSLSACSGWPPEGAGGSAEHVGPHPDCVPVNDGSSVSALDHRLGCANRRLQTLVRMGSKHYQPGLIQAAERQSRRVIRELTGGLYSDAVIDLHIFSAQLDEIERRMSVLVVDGHVHDDQSDGNLDSDGQSDQEI